MCLEVDSIVDRQGRGEQMKLVASLVPMALGLWETLRNESK
ncbi:hypothetical protein ACUALS_01590 [Vibrio sp. NH-7]